MDVNPVGWLSNRNIGRRTGKDVLSGKIIRKDSDGFELFEDYFTESEAETTSELSKTGDQLQIEKNEYNRDKRQGFSFSQPVAHSTAYSSMFGGNMTRGGILSQTESTLGKSSISNSKSVNMDYNPVGWLDNRNIGRRTGKDVLSGKIIRKDADGFEMFEDYFTESEMESSSVNISSTRSYLNISTEPSTQRESHSVYEQSQTPDNGFDNSDSQSDVENECDNYTSDISKTAPTANKLSSQNSELDNSILRMRSTNNNTKDDQISTKSKFSKSYQTDDPDSIVRTQLSKSYTVSSNQSSTVSNENISKSYIESDQSFGSSKTKSFKDTTENDQTISSKRKSLRNCRENDQSNTQSIELLNENQQNSTENSNHQDVDSSEPEKDQVTPAFTHTQSTVSSSESDESEKDELKTSSKANKVLSEAEEMTKSTSMKSEVQEESSIKSASIKNRRSTYLSPPTDKMDTSVDQTKGLSQPSHMDVGGNNTGSITKSEDFSTSIMPSFRTRKRISFASELEESKRKSSSLQQERNEKTACEKEKNNERFLDDEIEIVDQDTEEAVPRKVIKKGSKSFTAKSKRLVSVNSEANMQRKTLDPTQLSNDLDIRKLRSKNKSRNAVWNSQSENDEEDICDEAVTTDQNKDIITDKQIKEKSNSKETPTQILEQTHKYDSHRRQTFRKSIAHKSLRSTSVNTLNQNNASNTQTDMASDSSSDFLSLKISKKSIEKSSELQAKNNRKSALSRYKTFNEGESDSSVDPNIEIEKWKKGKKSMRKSVRGAEKSQDTEITYKRVGKHVNKKSNSRGTSENADTQCQNHSSIVDNGENDGEDARSVNQNSNMKMSASDISMSTSVNLSPKKKTSRRSHSASRMSSKPPENKEHDEVFILEGDELSNRKYEKKARKRSVKKDTSSRPSVGVQNKRNQSGEEILNQDTGQIEEKLNVENTFVKRKRKSKKSSGNSESDQELDSVHKNEQKEVEKTSTSKRRSSSRKSSEGRTSQDESEVKQPQGSFGSQSVHEVESLNKNESLVDQSAKNRRRTSTRTNNRVHSEQEIDTGDEKENSVVGHVVKKTSRSNKRKSTKSSEGTQSGQEIESPDKRENVNDSVRNRKRASTSACGRFHSEQETNTVNEIENSVFDEADTKMKSKRTRIGASVSYLENNLDGRDITSINDSVGRKKKQSKSLGAETVIVNNNTKVIGDIVIENSSEQPQNDSSLDKTRDETEDERSNRSTLNGSSHKRKKTGIRQKSKDIGNVDRSVLQSSKQEQNKSGNSKAVKNKAGKDTSEEEEEGGSEKEEEDRSKEEEEEDRSDKEEGDETFEGNNSIPVNEEEGDMIDNDIEEEDDMIDNDIDDDAVDYMDKDTTRNEQFHDGTGKRKSDQIFTPKSRFEMTDIPKSGISFRHTSHTSMMDASRKGSSHSPDKLRRNILDSAATGLTPILKQPGSAKRKNKRRVTISNLVTEKSFKNQQNISSEHAERSELSSVSQSGLSLNSTPVHIFQTTTTESPAPFVIPPKRPKIFLPEEAPPGLRRSKRVRCEPVASYKGERVIYERRKSGLSIVKVEPSHVEMKILQMEAERKKQMKKRKKRKQSSPRRNLSVHGTPDPDLHNLSDNYIPIPVPDTEDEVLIECMSSKDSEVFVGPSKSEPVSSDPYIMSLRLNQKQFLMGSLIIRPLKRKPEQLVSKGTMIFTLLEGKVSVLIHRTKMVAEAGDMFFIPQGSVYSIKNLRKEEAKLTFSCFFLSENMIDEYMLIHPGLRVSSVDHQTCN